MLSSITILSIFVEIFAIGILVTGIYGYLKRFFLARSSAYFWLGGIYFTLFWIVALTIVSQLLFNLGTEPRVLMGLHRWIAVGMVLAMMFTWGFVGDTLGLVHRLLWYVSGAVGTLLLWYQVLASDVNLLYRNGVIEPVVQFSRMVPIKSIWFAMWMVLAGYYVMKWRKAEGVEERKLFGLSGSSALLFGAGFLISLFYQVRGNPIYLLLSWLAMFLSLVGFFLGTTIRSDRALAKRPLTFFRTRIFYKLILIFVVLVVVLLESTMLVMIQLNRKSLAESIIQGQSQQASELARRISVLLTKDMVGELRLVARVNGLQRGEERQAMHRMLQTLLDTNAMYQQLWVLAPHGEKLSTALSKNGSWSRDLPVDIREAILSQTSLGNPYMSAVRQETDLLNSCLFLAVPFQQSGHGVGALVAKVGLSQIQSLVLKTEVEKQGFAYVVSSDGKLLMHPDIRRAALREDVSWLPIIQEAVRGGMGGLEFSDQVGEQMVGAYAPVPLLGWSVIVQSPVREAYYEIRRMETNSLIFVIVGMLMTGVVGLFYARSIERSIRKLIRGTKELRRGNLDYRISLNDIDEIGKLADAFNQMAADLKQSQHNLVRSEKLAALGTMAAGMAHEIKNPLVSLKTFTQILPQKHHDEAFIQKFNSIVPNEIDRINKIAENLLRFGRPAKPEFRLGDVNHVLQEVGGLFDVQCRKSGIKLRMMLGEVPSILLDEEQLSQAVINLTLNAIQAMPEGKPDAEVVLETIPEREADKVIGVRLKVSDNGKGILSEHLDRLFDPFFTTKRGGTGMGLSITQRIVEEHGGTIRVESEYGKGTAFILTLPRREEEPLPKQEHVPPDTDVL